MNAETRYTTVNFHDAPISEVAIYVARAADIGIVFHGVDDRITWDQRFPTFNIFTVFTSVLNSQGYYFGKEDSGLWSIRKFDQGTDVLSGAFLILPLKNVVANDLKESFQLLFGNRLRLSGSEKDSRVVVVVGQLSLLPQASEIIRRFDEASAPAADHDVLDISNELVRKIDTRLRSVLGDSVGIAPNPWTRQILVKGTPSQRLVARAVVDMMDKPRTEVRQVVRLHRLVASDVVPVIAELAEAAVVHSAGASEILIVGPSVEVRKLVEVIRDLDGGREQVRVDAIIAVLSDDGLETLGTRLEVKDSNFLQKVVAEGLSISGPNLLLDLVKSPVKFGVTASSRESNGRVLSSPSLTVLDGNKASILVGQNIPLISKHAPSQSGDKESHDGVEVQRVDVGLSLQITPSIEGDFVRLNILQEVSGVAPQDVGAIDVSTNVRRIETAVLVPNGQTLYLGGVREEEAGEIEWKVPLLGDLPFIGRVFQSESKSRRGLNLVISIKPSVISREVTL